MDSISHTHKTRYIPIGSMKIYTQRQKIQEREIRSFINDVESHHRPCTLTFRKCFTPEPSQNNSIEHKKRRKFVSSTEKPIHWKCFHISATQLFVDFLLFRRFTRYFPLFSLYFKWVLNIFLLRRRGFYRYNSWSLVILCFVYSSTLSFMRCFE